MGSSGRVVALAAVAGALTAFVVGTSTGGAAISPAPVARCDVFWTQPGGVLSIPAPGLLGNDSGAGGLRVTGASFSRTAYPYEVNAATGAGGVESAPTHATIFVQRTPPTVAQARAVGCPRSSGTPDKLVARTDFAVSNGARAMGNVLANDTDSLGYRLRLTSWSAGRYGSVVCTRAGPRA